MSINSLRLKMYHRNIYIPSRYYDVIGEQMEKVRLSVYVSPVAADKIRTLACKKYCNMSSVSRLIEEIILKYEEE